MKRAVPTRTSADSARVPILYPRPDYLPIGRGVDDATTRSPTPPTMPWDQAAPPSFILLDNHAAKRPRWNEPAWAHDRRRDHDQLPPMVPMTIHPLHSTPTTSAPPPIAPAESDPSSDAESGDKDEDNEPLKKLHASKKRNRMKDEIDALRKEVGSMTRHLDWLRVNQLQQSPHQAPIWADIAKQQAHELARVMAENQHLRHALEQHLDIAQEYIDTIIPKSPPPVDTVTAALPIIMCL